MKKKFFLQNWKGPRNGSGRLTWEPVEESTLTEKEKESLMRGYAISREESPSGIVEILVMDEDNIPYTVKINKIFTLAIETELSNVGYSVIFHGVSSILSYAHSLITSF